jgi:hypothetical protein
MLPSLFKSGRVGRRTFMEKSTMGNDRIPPETRGITVQPLAAVDLGPEIEGMAGRQLRMRMVTIEPGGVFGPVHDHRDRPGGLTGKWELQRS